MIPRSSIAYLLWLALFGAEAFLCVRAATALARTGERLEASGARTQRAAADIAAARAQIEAGNRDLAFLRNLPNVLPQDKGYLRTQAALLEEVRALRGQVSARLKSGVYVLVDAKANKLYLKDGLKLLWQADCSVGRGGVLTDKKTGRHWDFVTPRGEFKVLTKIDKPAWKKPDWAYVETGEKVIPAPDDPARLVQGELGEYALSLGHGYLIHGTPSEARLGQAVSHGCVRLGAADLKRLYDSVPVGTRVFIFY